MNQIEKNYPKDQDAIASQGGGILLMDNLEGSSPHWNRDIAATYNNTTKYNTAMDKDFESRQSQNDQGGPIIHIVA